MNQEPQAAVYVLAPTGRLDAAAAPRLRQDMSLLLNHKHPFIIINLGSVLYVSSSALRILLSAHKTAKKNGGALVLCCVPPQVLRVIAMVGFDQIFRIHETQELAQAALEPAARAAIDGGKKQ